MIPHPPDSTACTFPGALAGDASGIRSRAPQLWTLAGFMAGYFVMYNGWVQLCWLAVGLTWILVAGNLRWVSRAWSRDVWLRAFLGLLVWVVATSACVTWRENGDPWRLVEWVSGAGLLWLVCALCWNVGGKEEDSDRLSWTAVAAGSVAATASLVGFLPQLFGTYMGSRLENPLVYGGLNSVCTALTLGFAASWASIRSVEVRSTVERRWLLAAQFVGMLACLFTLSRGGILAMGVAQCVAVGVNGWHRSRRTVAVTAVVACVFLLVGTLRTSVPGAGARTPTAAEKLAKGPVAGMIERGDSNRLQIYRAGYAALQTRADHLFGKGLWMDDDCWRCGLSSNPNHLHSVFVAALVQSGWLGLAGFMWVIGWGFLRVIRLARLGQSSWLVLSSFGAAGLVFDGQSPFSLVTMPRFEALILWMPLGLGSAAYVRARARGMGRLGSEEKS